MNLSEIKNAAEYLDALYECRSECLIVISACDNIGRYMTESIADKFVRLGLLDLHPARALGGIFQLPYIAVLDKGKLCYEKLGKKDEEAIEYEYCGIKITSSKYSFQLPRNTSIFFRGYDFASVERGFNIFVLKKGVPLDAVLLDFSEKEAVFSRPFKMSCIQEYESFRKNYKGPPVPNLALHVGEYPYGETAVVRKKVANLKKDRTDFLCEKNGLKKYEFENATFLTSAPPIKDCKGNICVFHGVARWRNKFIIGSGDIERLCVNAAELKEAVGCFALAIIKGGGGVELSADWFGSQAWFYYESRELFAAATSYHLLLLTLKALGQKLALDTRRVIAAQSFFGAAFEHGMSYKMDVLGVTELAPDKRIFFDKSGNIFFHNTTLHFEEHFPKEYSQALYEKLLSKTKNEIIQNCRAVFEHPGIDFVRQDLTGGMDSRMILGAITNLPKQLQKKLRVSTGIREDLQKDYEIANEISAALDLKWDDLPYCVSAPEEKKGEVYYCRASKGLGTSCEFVDLAKESEVSKSIKFIGAYGELLTKVGGDIYGDFSLPLLGCEKRLARQIDIKQNGNAFKFAKKFIRQILNDAKTEKTNFAFDHYYLHLGCRHHFLLNKGNLVWSPLMSKSGFRLRMMYTNCHTDLKLRFDLMAALNPLLACFEYDKPKVNEEKERLFERLAFQTRAKVVLPQGVCHESFKEAVKRKKASFFPDKESVKKANDAVRNLYENRQIHLSALKTFLDYSEDFCEIAFPLFCFFNKEHGAQKYHSGFRYEINRINRLLQIYWTIKIIEEE